MQGRFTIRLFGMADDINKLKEKNMIIEAFDQCESLLRVRSKLGEKKSFNFSRDI